MGIAFRHFQNGIKANTIRQFNYMASWKESIVRKRKNVPNNLDAIKSWRQRFVVNANGMTSVNSNKKKNAFCSPSSILPLAGDDWRFGKRCLIRMNTICFYHSGHVTRLGFMCVRIFRNGILCLQNYQLEMKYHEERGINRELRGQIRQLQADRVIVSSCDLWVKLCIIQCRWGGQFECYPLSESLTSNR